MDLRYPSDPEYKKLNQEVCELTDKLKNHMTSDDSAALDIMMKKGSTTQTIEYKSCFCFALATGMQL